MKRFNEGWDFASGEIEQARGMNSESAITDAIIKRVKEVESDRDPQATYWVELGYDDKNTYACVMCWCDKDNAEYFGYEDEADFVLAKIAFCPDNSAMNEYDIDWMMPYDEETGEVWNTELQISSSDWSDADWLAEEWLAIMDRINKSAGYEQLVDDDELTEGLAVEGRGNPKTVEVAVLQGNYGYGWDDLCQYRDLTWGSDDRKEMQQDLKDYRENEPQYRHRIIYRRVPNPNYKDPNVVADEGCHGGKKKKKKKVLNQKKVCGEDAKRTKNGYTFYIDDNAEPEIVRKGLVDYTLDGFIDKGDFDAPCKIGFYDGDDEPAYIFVSGGVTDDGYEFEKETIEL